MQIRVKPIGQLRYALPGHPRELSVDMPIGATVQDLMQQLALPGHLVWYASVDAETVPMEHVLADGAEVVFYTPVVGGSGRYQRRPDPW